MLNGDWDLKSLPTPGVDSAKDESNYVRNRINMSRSKNKICDLMHIMILVHNRSTYYFDRVSF